MARIRMGLVAALLFATACSAGHLSHAGSLEGTGAVVTVPGGNDPPPGDRSEQAAPGVDLVPLHIPLFIYGQPTLDPKVQPETRALTELLGKRSRLHVVGLPSPPGTVAVDFTEVSPPGHRWGEVMFPAERSLFRAFARDAATGTYLVVLTDVEVLRAPDPVPLTAYRWSRTSVESYAGCGIPNLAIDACTTAFYATADTKIIHIGGVIRGA